MSPKYLVALILVSNVFWRKLPAQDLLDPPKPSRYEQLSTFEDGISIAQMLVSKDSRSATALSADKEAKLLKAIGSWQSTTGRHPEITMPTQMILHVAEMGELVESELTVDELVARRTELNLQLQRDFEPILSEEELRAVYARYFKQIGIRSYLHPRLQKALKIEPDQKKAICGAVSEFMKELIAATLNRAASADEQQSRKVIAFTAFNESLKSILDPDQLESAKELFTVK